MDALLELIRGLDKNTQSFLLVLSLLALTGLISAALVLVCGLIGNLIDAFAGVFRRQPPTIIRCCGCGKDDDDEDEEEGDDQ